MKKKRIYIDYSDGHYTWSDAGDRVHGTIVEISSWQYQLLELGSRVSRSVQRYLCRLDNEWFEQNEKK